MRFMHLIISITKCPFHLASYLTENMCVLVIFYRVLINLSKIARISLVCSSGHTSFVTLVSLKQNQEIFGEKQAFTISDENQSVHAMPISSVHAYVKPCVTCSAERQNKNLLDSRLSVVIFNAVLIKYIKI